MATKYQHAADRRESSAVRNKKKTTARQIQIYKKAARRVTTAEHHAAAGRAAADSERVVTEHALNKTDRSLRRQPRPGKITSGRAAGASAASAHHHPVQPQGTVQANMDRISQTTRLFLNTNSAPPRTRAASLSRPMTSPAPHIPPPLHNSLHFPPLPSTGPQGEPVRGGQRTAAVRTVATPSRATETVDPPPTRGAQQTERKPKRTNVYYYIEETALPKLSI
ncbi:hypothetical protein KGM_204600 [Danaus plexippus plexippus]|uniref:Uncharacterized protein n=1 Tax=Danaus plexippus plexippus TaxID=278856 RepID=A0A212FD31_DANPL|nr:hypothetical protein KGM_204600 [Danaus plexippus plexippus]